MTTEVIRSSKFHYNTAVSNSIILESMMRDMATSRDQVLFTRTKVCKKFNKHRKKKSIHFEHKEILEDDCIFNPKSQKWERENVGDAFQAT